MLGFNLGTLCEARLRRRFKSDPRNDRINKNTNIKHLQRTSARHAVHRDARGEFSTETSSLSSDLRVEPSEPRGQFVDEIADPNYAERGGGRRGASASRSRSIPNRRVEADATTTDQLFVGGRKGRHSRPRQVADRQRRYGRLRRSETSRRARFIRGTKCVVVTALYPPWERVYTSALIYRQRRARLGYG